MAGGLFVPGCKGVLLLREIVKRLHRALQDVVVRVLRLARDVAHHERERQKNSHTYQREGIPVSERSRPGDSHA